MNPTRLVVAALALGIIALCAFLAFGGENGAPVTNTLEHEEQPTDRVDDASGAPEDPIVDASSQGVRVAVESSTTERPLHPSVRAALSGFRGRIVTPQLEPVDAVSVVLYRFSADSVITPRIGAFLADERSEPDIDAGDDRTDADGRFEITGVWPRGFYLLRAGVGTDTPINKIIEHLPGPGEIVDLGDIVVTPSGILTGTVVDDDGEPVVGALVRAADVPGGFLTMVPIEQFDPTGGLIAAEGDKRLAFECPPWVEKRFEELPIPMTRTDSSGAFRLAGVMPGTNLVAVTKPGKLSSVRPSVRVDAGVEKDLGEFRLREGEELYGRVVDGEGEPIEGVEVLAAAVNSVPVHFARFLSPTNASGEFDATGFPSGSVIVAVRRQAGEPWIITEEQPITRDIEIVLASHHTLNVSIASEAGLELEDVELQLCPGDRDEGAVEMAMWGVTRPLSMRNRLSRDEDGRWVISDVPTGEYTLLVRAAGHAFAGVEVKVEGDTDATVRLPARRSFEVRVVDEFNEPIGGADVYAHARSRPQIPDMPVHCGTTEDDGFLTVDELNATKVRVTASHPAWGNTHSEFDIPSPGPVLLRMQRPGSIEGILTENGGKPTAGKWLVTLNRRRSDGESRGAMPDLPRTVVPSIDGRFRADGLRPGEWEVGSFESVKAVTSPGGLMGLMQTAWMRGGNPESRVIVTPGATANVLLDTAKSLEDIGPSAQVTGIALLDGAPASGAIVMAWGEGRRVSAQVGDDGTFDLGRLKVGHANLQLYDVSGSGTFEFRNDSLWSRSLEIKENEDHHLSINISLSALSGIVIGLAGEPVADCSVTLNGTAEGGADSMWLSEETDKNGRFEFARIPAGTYSIEAQDEVGKAREEGIVVLGGNPVSGLRLSMMRLQRVSGTVDMAGFGSGDYDWVWMQFDKVVDEDESSDSQWVGIDKDTGNFETTELSSGRWRVTFHGPPVEDGQWVHEGEVVVGAGDVAGLRLMPIVKKNG